MSGEVTDQQNAVIPDVEVEAKNIDTGITYPTKTNKEGFYSIPDLPPGNYLMNVRKPQFRSVTATGITLHVQDQLSKNFVLQVGSVDESVTVSAAGNNINTTDGSVSTVIDNQFVENLPLNGRSFSSLVLLTPGAVSSPSNFGGFNINGQRNNTNYFTVDGVSANFGVGTGLLYNAGQGPATTSFGGTNSLLSIDSLQEFRILTSSFAPEFGRSPGGQVEVTTKSGTNAFHGDLFDYFRNNALDANDWFYDQAVQTAPPGTITQPQLRQNDFGGVFGGPIVKDKTFFFVSYEGLRLFQPEVQQFFVPDLATRQSIPSPLNQLVNVLPLPNGPDQGNGFAGFTQTASAQQNLDVGAIRIDHEVTSKLSLFGRASFAASSSQTPSFGQLIASNFPTRFVTVGLNSETSPHLSEQFRFNYSLSKNYSIYSLPNAEGGVALNTLAVPAPYTSLPNYTFYLISNDGANYAGYDVGPTTNNSDRQFNSVDDVSLSLNRHVLKFGVDFRNSKIQFTQASRTWFYYQCYVADLIGGGCSFVEDGNLPATSGFTANNWSVYAQDTWRLKQRLVLTYGLRWDINPGPKATPGSTYFVGQNINDLPEITVSQTSQLWTTKYRNFAPRVGVAWTPFGSDRLTIRSGFGVFYDTGLSPAGEVATNGAPGSNYTFPSFVTLPLASNPYVPAISLTPPFAYEVPLINPAVNLPYSLQWNFAIETALSREDSLSVTYVGQAGRRLLNTEWDYSPNSNFDSWVGITGNESRSNYNALQLQYRHHLGRGLQVLANYTWSHSLDSASVDSPSGLNVPFSVIAYTNQYGSSDFDVRQNFSAAVTYDVPTPSQARVLRALLGGWGLDSIVYARSGFPIDVREGDPSVHSSRSANRVPTSWQVNRFGLLIRVHRVVRRLMQPHLRFAHRTSREIYRETASQASVTRSGTRRFVEHLRCEKTGSSCCASICLTP